MEYQIVKSFHIIAIIAWMSFKSNYEPSDDNKLAPRFVFNFPKPKLTSGKLDDSKNYLRDIYDLLSHEIWTHKKRI